MSARDPLQPVENSLGNALIRHSLLLFVMLSFPLAAVAEQADSVLVDKSDEKLYLLKSGSVIAEYSVRFGANPEGHKAQEGDERTPEGTYVLDYKKSDSAFYKAIHISYPNEADKKAAAAKGVDPGGAIMIHGQRSRLGWLSFITQRFNWTDGCIAVTNKEMDEIWNLVPANTPITIQE
jgi:murein L,D-transpeptidase YafK